MAIDKVRIRTKLGFDLGIHKLMVDTFRQFRRGPLIIAVLLAVCFGQFRTVAHIHHSHHDDDGLPITFSVHPLDVDPAHSPHHHNHSHDGRHDHHDNDDHQDFELNYSKWFLTRSQQMVPSLAVAVVPFRASTLSTRPFIVGRSPVSDQPIIPGDQWERFKSDPRSPPQTV